MSAKQTPKNLDTFELRGHDVNSESIEFRFDRIDFFVVCIVVSCVVVVGILVVVPAAALVPCVLLLPAVFYRLFLLWVQIQNISLDLIDENKESDNTLQTVDFKGFEKA